MTSHIDCPILLDAHKALSAGNNLARALRKLRKSRRFCQNCPRLKDCQVWQGFNQQVDLAIREVNREWGLDETLG